MFSTVIRFLLYRYQSPYGSVLYFCQVYQTYVPSKTPIEVEPTFVKVTYSQTTQMVEKALMFYRRFVVCAQYLGLQ